jgi:hypothetical protein
MRARVKFGSTYAPFSSLPHNVAQKGHDLNFELHGAPQMLLNPINIECFFLFKFGTGNEKELVIRITEFVDSKKFLGMQGKSAEPEMEDD